MKARMRPLAAAAIESPGSGYNRGLADVIEMLRIELSWPLPSGLSLPQLILDEAGTPGLAEIKGSLLGSAQSKLAHHTRLSR